MDQIRRRYPANDPAILPEYKQNRTNFGIGTLDGLYQIKNEELEQIDITDQYGDSPGFGQLSLVNGQLCSVGEYNIILYDGNNIEAIPTD